MKNTISRKLILAVSLFLISTFYFIPQGSLGAGRDVLSGKVPSGYTMRISNALGLSFIAPRLAKVRIVELLQDGYVRNSPLDGCTIDVQTFTNRQNLSLSQMQSQEYNNINLFVSHTTAPGDYYKLATSSLILKSLKMAVIKAKGVYEDDNGQPYSFVSQVGFFPLKVQDKVYGYFVTQGCSIAQTRTIFGSLKVIR